MTRFLGMSEFFGGLLTGSCGWTCEERLVSGKFILVTALIMVNLQGNKSLIVIRLINLEAHQVSYTADANHTVLRCSL